jgi:hypothetical protein
VALGGDPVVVFGEQPAGPGPVGGWGTLPDQYGRTTEYEDEGFDDEEADEDLDVEGLEGEDLEVEAGETSTAASWEVVERALRAEERSRPDDELERALQRLQDHLAGTWSLAVLLAAAGLDPDGLGIGDREDVWIALAAGTFEPRESLPLEPDDLDAWVALEPAAYAGAVIGLVRAGEGQQADPDVLCDLVATCPEVESENLSQEEGEALIEGFGVVTALWQALGAVDARNRLTALGRWGLPEALRRAWVGPLEVG